MLARICCAARNQRKLGCGGWNGSSNWPTAESAKHDGSYKTRLLQMVTKLGGVARSAPVRVEREQKWDSGYAVA